MATDDASAATPVIAKPPGEPARDGSSLKPKRGSLVHAFTAIAFVFAWLLPLIFAIITTATGVMLYVVMSSHRTPHVEDRLLLAAAIQIGLGMIIGFACILFGVMMTWFGLTGAFAFGAKVNKAGVSGEATLSSAAPGLAFLLAGTILISIALLKPLHQGPPREPPPAVAGEGDDARHSDDHK